MSDCVRKVWDCARKLLDGVGKVSDGVGKVSYGIKKMSDGARSVRWCQEVPRVYFERLLARPEYILKDSSGAQSGDSECLL